MSGVQLYHSPTCPYSRRVRFALELAGVSYEETVVRWEDGAPDWFKAISPAGEVPVLDDGHVMAESQVQLEYIADAYAPELRADTPRERAIQRARASRVNDLILQPAAKAARGDEAARQKLASGLKEVETWFGPGTFVDGDHPGLLDVMLSSAIASDAYGVQVPSELTRLSAWRTALRAYAAFQRVPAQYVDAIASA